MNYILFPVGITIIFFGVLVCTSAVGVLCILISGEGKDKDTLRRIGVFLLMSFVGPMLISLGLWLMP